MKDLLKSNASETVVGENVKVSGKLHTTSSIQINGEVKGEVQADGGVIIGKAATISGPIRAKSVKIEGTVKGNIDSSEELELDSTAKVYGDIQTKSLSIKAGAIFVGKSSMEGEEGEEELKKKKGEGKKKETKEIQEESEPEFEIE